MKPLSAGSHDIIPGRSSDFPSFLAAFPQNAVAYEAKEAPSHILFEGKDYSGGPVPAFHRIPFSSNNWNLNLNS